MSDSFSHPFQQLQEAVSQGFSCGVNVCYNFSAHHAADILSLMKAGKVDEAKEAQKAIVDLLGVIFKPSMTCFVFCILHSGFVYLLLYLIIFLFCSVLCILFFTFWYSLFWIQFAVITFLFLCFHFAFFFFCLFLYSVLHTLWLQRMETGYTSKLNIHT